MCIPLSVILIVDQNIIVITLIIICFNPEIVSPYSFTMTNYSIFIDI